MRINNSVKPFDPQILYKQLTTSNGIIMSAGKKKVTKKSAVKKLTLKKRKPTTKKRKPTTKKRKPTTKKRKPTTKKRKPTTKKRKPTTKKRKPTTKKRKPTTKKRKPTTKKRKPTTKNKKGGADPHPIPNKYVVLEIDSIGTVSVLNNDHKLFKEMYIFLKNMHKINNQQCTIDKKKPAVDRFKDFLMETNNYRRVADKIGEFSPNKMGTQEDDLEYKYIFSEKGWFGFKFYFIVYNKNKKN